MIGQTISHYKILSKLGEGGMGVVYKAEDTKLQRFVALKFLHPELTRDEEAKTRFIHEAQAAAALSHPHICTIHEIDEYEGQSFIAMEFIEGEGLKDRIQKGPLPIDDLLSLTIQIGEGLQKAHEKGIVHRDIKPANIMVTGDGVVKILDFGLARLGTQTKITKTDTTLGTAAYMSPEQASGKDVDGRTDIWSLGVVLYEMVTGVRPFTGEYEPAVVYSILHDNPEPVTSRRSNVPMELERIVGKALTKEASGRYPHVEDMLVDLRALRSTTQSQGVSQPQKAAAKGRRSKALIAGIAAVVVVAAIAAAIAVLPRLFKPAPPPGKPPVTDNRKMIVVLPFENLGAPEDEYFANGTTDAITARLASVSGLGVISRQSAMQYKRTTKTIRQIGSELDVDYVLEGTVQRERPGDPASRVRVIPQLIRVADDTHVWAQTYDDNMTEVFRVQSEIAERVATQLDVALLEPERRAIEKRPTENLAAYDDYLRGMDYYYGIGDQASAELSVQMFEHAVSLDPRFTEAWAGLTAAYHHLYWVFDRPGALTLEIDATRRAEELAPDLPETHLALGRVAYAQRKFDKALAHYEKAQRLRPTGDAALALGTTMRRLGRWQDALNQFEEARRLIPRSYLICADALGVTNSWMRRFDEAERNLNEAISLSPHLSEAYVRKAHVLIARDGDVDAARQVLSEMSRRTDLTEAAEFGLIQGTLWTAEFRLFPNTFTEVFDAFESGPVERYRRMQPAIIATAHLARAIVYEAVGDGQSASARYDSARVYFERMIRSNPQSAFVCMYHSNLGRAYAGLGRCEEAIREGEDAVRMLPISKDAFGGPAPVMRLAEIYVKCGKYDAAIDQIETLLSVPSAMSAGLLRADPIWDPIRSNPRFRRLVEGK
jgi:TolB-like protein/tRNA A-37 threonylcarbamoyl transferase component Bud32/Tfp pilus assembly protein PilF